MFKRTALIVLALVTGAFGQGSRAVTGVVTDSRGNPLPGAAVQIENSRSMEIQSYLTRDDGKYYFHDLSRDTDYTLKAKYKRWWSKEKLLNKLNAAKQVTIDLTIPIE
ncbi:carboxypeptidase-like regulatory domain-containing protein [Nevskia soli]|jgi:hypothetical protein|uniref:carboxypeptidase-like regulatory domain-containing protein n=1 Tax=Nevskia soli TaxID=418856 RepID=UPI0015D8B7FF|nr:carboxypeptidase-like regulatory domain-containing protein [Nevskia soli]